MCIDPQVCVAVTVCCSVLQCVTLCCSALQCAAVCCRLLQCGVVRAVCCSVYLDNPCVAWCGAMLLQCVAVTVHVCDVTQAMCLT